MNITKKLVIHIHRLALNYLKKHNSYKDKIITQKKANPMFIIHIGATDIASALLHSEHWINNFINSGFEFLVITRGINSFNAIKNKYPNVNLSLITKAYEVEEILEHYKSIKAIFYLGNTANNIHLITFPKIKHIFIGHGDSEKHASMTRAFKVYDEIYVSGDAHIDRFKNADFDTSALKFTKIGRPGKKIYDGNDSSKIKNIIYIPTWEGHNEKSNYSSLHIIKDNIAAILNTTQLNLYVKLHPVTGLRLPNYKSIEDSLKAIKNNNLIILDKQQPLSKLTYENTIYICDISSTITESLATQGPIITYLPDEHSIERSRSKIDISEYCYTYQDTHQLTKIIEQLLTSNDPLKNARNKALNYFIDIRATKENEFKKQLEKLHSM